MIKGKNSVDAKYIFHDVVFKFIFNVLGKRSFSLKMHKKKINTYVNN